MIVKIPRGPSPRAASDAANSTIFELSALEVLTEPLPTEQRVAQAPPTDPPRWRGDRGREFIEYTVEVDDGMVVLDLIHRVQEGAGERPRVPLELQGRQVRLLLGWRSTASRS
jgi:hypothetical protein